MMQWRDLSPFRRCRPKHQFSHRQRPEFLAQTSRAAQLEDFAGGEQQRRNTRIDIHLQPGHDRVVMPMACDSVSSPVGSLLPA